MSNLPFNLPLFSIPLYYILSHYPRAHSVFAISAKGNIQQNVGAYNANPYSSESEVALKKRLTARELAAYERAIRCHRNCLENAPLFIAAIFAGLLAEQRVGTGEIGLNPFVVGWMVMRAVYVLNYLYAETVNWSYVRTICYNVSTGWAIVLIWRAAWALG